MAHLHFPGWRDWFKDRARDPRQSNRVFSAVLSLLNSKSSVFLPRLLGLVTVHLEVTVAMPLCPLSHGRSPATAEEKEACLQRWGEGSVGKCGALHLVAKGKA